MDDELDLSILKEEPKQSLLDRLSPPIFLSLAFVFLNLAIAKAALDTRTVMLIFGAYLSVLMWHRREELRRASENVRFLESLVFVVRAVEEQRDQRNAHNRPRGRYLRGRSGLTLAKAETRRPLDK